MSTTDDVIAAIDAEGSTSWMIADVVAAFDETDVNGKPLTLIALSQRIFKRRGLEWSPVVLGQYRATARAFPIESRDSMPTQTFGVAKELRAHPEKLVHWKPKKPDDVLTVERARALRGGTQGSKSATSPKSVEAQARQLVDKLDRLAELEPLVLVDLLSAMVDDWRQRYAKRIEKKRRGLTAVS